MLHFKPQHLGLCCSQHLQLLTQLQPMQSPIDKHALDARTPEGRDANVDSCVNALRR